MWLLLLATFGSLFCCAANAKVQITGMEIGFKGRCKVGHWTPLRVSILAADDAVSGQLRITIPDCDGVPTTLLDEVDSPVRIPANTSVTLVRYVRLARPRGSLEVSFVGERGELARRTFSAADFPKPLPARQTLVLTLGRPVGIQQALQTRLRGHAASITAVEIESADTLPTDASGYGGVDTIVVPTSEISILEQMSERQFAALDRWLHLGGRMVLSVGQRGEAVFASGSRLLRFSPGGAARTVSQRSLVHLESYCGAKQSLDAAGGTRVRRFSLKMTALEGVRGHVDTSEVGGPFGSIPTIVRFPYGFGQIVFVAVDLDQRPFSHWQSQPTLIAKIVFDDLQEPQEETDPASRAASITQIGYTDMIGQLRSALDQFQGVTRVEFSWVAGLLAVYIALIGPVDYFLLKRLGRLHATWITFPLIVALFAVGGVVFANRWAGDRLHANQLDIVDVDVESQLVRGFSWSHLYSPTSQTFDLSLAEKLPVAAAADGQREMLFSWQGLPGNGLGGLDRESGSAVAAQPYELIRRSSRPAATDWSLRGVPIQVASSRSFTARWWADAQIADRSDLSTDRNGLLIGSVENPLQVELTDSLLMFENWAYRLPNKLVPGQAVSLNGASPLNLEWRLTRRRVVETKDVNTPWDPLSSDVARIGEVMMFFNATGAAGYTGLSHGYQPETDLSRHLRTGRAVLVGRSERRAADLQRDQRSMDDVYDQNWTWYRVVFPVARS